MWMRQYTKKSPRKGQSILELAIFGSIVLFVFSVLIQYGISLNYSQHHILQSFRRALFESKNKSPSAAPAVSVSFTSIKDLPIPNPANPFGLGQTSPVVASVSATQSRHLMDRYHHGPSELPRAEFIINGRRYTYTTADFGYHDCSGRSIKVKKTDYARIPSRWDDERGPCWYWGYETDYDLEAGDEIDIDNDGKGESIVDVEQDDDGDLEEFWYLDFQEGQIDMTVNPREGPVQGLQDQVDKTVTSSGTIQKTESASGITSSRQASVTEVIRRLIRTRSGTHAATSTVSQQDSSTWQTGW